MHELIKKINQFRQERDWDPYHSPKNLVMALSVEVAELVEHFQHRQYSTMKIILTEEVINGRQKSRPIASKR